MEDNEEDAYWDHLSMQSNPKNDFSIFYLFVSLSVPAYVKNSLTDLNIVFAVAL